MIAPFINMGSGGGEAKQCSEVSGLIPAPQQRLIQVIYFTFSDKLLRRWAFHLDSLSLTFSLFHFLLVQLVSITHKLLLILS